MNQSDPGVEQGWVTVEQAMAHPIPKGERSAPVLAHGSMVVKYYAPRESDEQTPHTRDELYVVARGSGWFVNGDSPSSVLRWRRLVCASRGASSFRRLHGRFWYLGSLLRPRGR
jgi:hypothetical protein